MFDVGLDQISLEVLGGDGAVSRHERGLNVPPVAVDALRVRLPADAALEMQDPPVRWFSSRERRWTVCPRRSMQQDEPERVAAAVKRLVARI